MQDSDIARDPIRYLRYPMLRQRTFKVRSGELLVHVYDQPGRWMDDEPLRALRDRLVDVAGQSMDEVPTYGVFTGERSAYENRIVGVMTEASSGEAVAFTAMVYLPILLDHRIEPVMHLGLTMIKRRFRGQRLQGPLFEKLFFLPTLNQLRVRWIVTNIAASPAGIGSVSDYFQDPYPSYHGNTERKGYHGAVAKEMLAHYRHEFGCSRSATLDPDTFVVVGSNDPAGGGAYQFLREDPVSRYKRQECNTFCAQRLRFERGDELFQVARLNMIRGVLDIHHRRGARKRATAAARSAPTPTTANVRGAAAPQPAPRPAPTPTLIPTTLGTSASGRPAHVAL
ncbi:MAG: hypothetical protein ABI333_20880 [bacterium]